MNIDDEFFSCSSSSCDSIDSKNTSFSDTETLVDKLSSIFNIPSISFSLVHINAQSIPAHYNDLLTSFGSGIVDCILVSETWLKPSLSSACFSLPGYQLFRNDRTERAGGGVGIYLRNNIPASVVSCSLNQPIGCLEYLFVEIQLRHKKILVGVLYSPNDKVNYFGDLEDVLENLTPQYEHIICMGDLNTCLLKNDSRTNLFKAINESYNLHILPMSSPTHFFPNCRPSQIDIISVSNPNLVISHGQMSAPFSFHDLIFLSYKLRPPRVRGKIFLQRNFKHMDMARLREDMGNIDWSPIMSLTNIDDMVEYLTTELINIYNIHAPVRPVRMKHAPAPWLTSIIRRSMSKRDKAKAKNRKYPSEANLATYKKLRNICNRMCRDSKRRYIHKTIQNLCQAKVWRFLESLGVGKTTERHQTSVDLNILNSNFTSPILNIHSEIKSQTLAFLSRINLPGSTPFSFRTVTEEEIKKYIHSISTKAVGSDNLSLEMILPVLEIIAPVVTHIINFSLSCNVFPSQWKNAYVVPLPKTLNPTYATDYRPISILPIFSKVLETIVYNQLHSYLSSNNLLCPYQSGFRPFHSTVSALLNITEDIRGAMDNTKLTVMVLLDFSSAFNSVNFDILLATLRAVNIPSSVISWFHSYLTGRRQCVIANDTTSTWLDLNAGVPQGGVLSPLLFSVFINNISQVISSPYHLYADDLQLYQHGYLNELPEIISFLNDNLSAIQRWSDSFGLAVNPKKSQAIIISSSRLKSRINWDLLPNIMYSGVTIPYYDKVKNLGLTIDSNMTWTSHINEISKRMHFSYHSLKRLQYFLPHKTKIMLAQCLLLPILDYADVCYLDVTEELLIKLERLQNLAIRFIYGLRKYDHVSQFRAQLKWLPIRLRRDMHILSFLFKILNYQNFPSYLHSRFKILPSPTRSRRSCVIPTLEIPKTNTKFMQKSFSVQAALLWNKLPKSIQQSSSIVSFKASLKKHFIKELDSTYH